MATLRQVTRSRHGLTCHKPVDIAAITRDALLAHDLTDLETVVTLKPAWTTGDPNRIDLLAANLLSNAARHNVPGGRIAIATRTEAQHAVLSIANTGSSIPSGELTRLFEPFQRLDSQPTSRDDGVGLGLAIVRAIADPHGAAITPHAQANGGLRIDIKFLASATAPSRSRPGPRAAACMCGLARSRVDALGTERGLGAVRRVGGASVVWGLVRTV